MQNSINLFIITKRTLLDSPIDKPKNFAFYLIFKINQKRGLNTNSIIFKFYCFINLYLLILNL